MSRIEPKWLDRHKVVALHGMQLAEHGGLAGIRDDVGLESALARPINKWHYEEPDMFDLAGAYAFGITMNHPFADGNKRTGFMAAYVFLGMNGIEIDAPEAEVVVMTLDLAADKLGEAGYSQWLRDRGVDWSD